jgi:hypothetical protein
VACKIATCSASQQSEVRGWHRHALVAVAVAGHEHALLSFCSLHPPPSPLSPLSPCPAGVLIRPQLIRCGGRMKGLAQNNSSAGDTPPPPPAMLLGILPATPFCLSPFGEWVSCEAEGRCYGVTLAPCRPRAALLRRRRPDSKSASPPLGSTGGSHFRAAVTGAVAGRQTMQTTGLGLNFLLFRISRRWLTDFT